MAKVHPNAEIAVYIDANGREIQREILSEEAKNRELSSVDEDFIDPWKVMTVEIRCLDEDRGVFKDALREKLGPSAQEEQPHQPIPAGKWAYTTQPDPDPKHGPLRYVFDTTYRIPLEIFASEIKSLTEAEPSRCQTVSMFVCGGCVYPCRPTYWGTIASCGRAANCPCP